MTNSAANKLKQIPVGYLVIGIDVHKKKHAAVVMTQDFTTYGKFKFSNSKEGFEMALERARMGMVKTGCRGVFLLLRREGTIGAIWLTSWMREAFPFHFINQFTLKRRREGKDLNRRKNDYRDSEVAAQLLCTGEFTATQLRHGVYAESL